MKDLEQSYFEHYVLDEKKLVLFGFEPKEGEYVLKTTLPTSKFKLVLKVFPNGEVDGTIYDDGFEYEPYRASILGNFAANVKEEYLDVLAQVRKDCFLSNKPVSYYLVPSNPKIYDVARGFEEGNGYLEWPTKQKTHSGDVVFIYSAVPFKGLAYRCSIVEASPARVHKYGMDCYLALLHLEETYEKGYLPLEELMEHGLRTVRFTHKVKEDFARYVLSKSSKN